MADLEPSITALNPNEPIVINLPADKDTGQSADYTISYSVTDNLFAEGQADVPFKSLLEVTNDPYRFVSALKSLPKDEVLKGKTGQFSFTFKLENNATTIGNPLPANLKITVNSARFDAKGFAVSLKKATS